MSTIAKQTTLLLLYISLLLAPAYVYGADEELGAYKPPTTSVPSASTDTDTLPLVGESAATPSGFSSDGLYGCAGGKFGSVGMMHAGKPFVPVSEQAVAINTNMLLYKECVLDGVVARIRETMVAFMVKSTLTWVNKNHNGESAFIVNLGSYKKDIKDKVTREFATGKRTEGICQPLRQNVRKSLLLENAQDNYRPENAYKCSVPEDQKDAYEQFLNGTGTFNSKTYLLTLLPENNPLYVYINAREQLEKDRTEKVTNRLTEALWGQGYKSHKVCKDIPSGNGKYEEYCQIVTPGSNIKEIIGYVSLTGQRQTESADEIDELMGSLMSNIHTQILTSIGGLGGLSQSRGGGTNFLDQVAGDAAARTRAQHTNIGIGLLADVIQTETKYGAARRASKDKIEDTAKQFQTKDKACWDKLIAQAQLDLIAEAEELACADIRPTDFGSGSSATSTCTIKGSATVLASTSTSPYGDILLDTGPKTQEIKITAKAGAKQVSVTLEKHNKNYLKILASDMAPLLNVVRQSVADSIKALTLLTGLQQNLTNSNTPGNTRFVLGQVDQLVREGKLHKSADIYIAQDQQRKITETMGDLYVDTTKEWDKAWCSKDNWRAQIKQ